MELVLHINVGFLHDCMYGFGSRILDTAFEIVSRMQMHSSIQYGTTAIMSIIRNDIVKSRTVKSIALTLKFRKTVSRQHGYVWMRFWITLPCSP